MNFDTRSACNVDPDGAVCWITKALEHAWPLPRFEADEFAAAFVAATKPSTSSGRMDYIAKAEGSRSREEAAPAEGS